MCLESQSDQLLCMSTVIRIKNSVWVCDHFLPSTGLSSTDDLFFLFIHSFIFALKQSQVSAITASWHNILRHLKSNRQMKTAFDCLQYVDMTMLCG